jgi:coenzyme F420-0:L-glutamate ligase/coenzyme F420-1:gamma-L-glutamate ligase
VVEVVLAESKRIVRLAQGVIIAETFTGLVCANAGVDQSNAPDPGDVVLLPKDPDASATSLRRALAKLTGSRIGVVITDTFGRPWREGLVDVAIGVSGLAPLVDHRGEKDWSDRRLEVTVMALADQLAAAAGLVMGKSEGIPAAILRGVGAAPGDGRGTDLVRPAKRDLFR